MKLSDYYFNLPEALIAQKPAEKRAGSRLLRVDRMSDSFSDHLFEKLPDLLCVGDLLVLNNTKVFPARLLGISETGANIEVFLVKKISTNEWQALARPGRRLRVGKRVVFGEGLSATVTAKLAAGMIKLVFESDGKIDDLIDVFGRTPLPPYIKRDNESLDTDRERYQTVYAKNRGAIAAPTAGLHFTPDILRLIRHKGIDLVEVTLHVGYGTFEPIRSADLSDHRVLPEQFEIVEEAARVLNRAKRDGRRIVAVGTTTTRALESNFARNGCFAAEAANAELTITPGYRFNAVDALLTNFHLPRSSLLVLTSVFGGHELIMNAYRHAVAERYRFYSYGDCMLIA